MTNSLLSSRIHPGDNPVLLIHGIASNAARDWEDTGFIAALAAAGRGAITVDLPGHGTGPALERGVAVTHDIADALAEIVADAGCDRVDVVGYSLGARLAWAFASTGRAGRVVLGGLSPMDPFAGFDVDGLAAVIAGTAAPADPMQGMFAQMLSAPGLDAPSVMALIEGLGAEHFDPSVGAPAGETLFLAGTEDPMAQGVQVLVDAVPGSRVVRVPGDHVGALASPEFREEALAFLTR